MATKPNEKKETGMSVRVNWGVAFALFVAVVGATVFITKAEGTGAQALEMAQENRESQKTIVATLSKIVLDMRDLTLIQRQLVAELKELKGDIKVNEHAIDDISRRIPHDGMMP